MTTDQVTLAASRAYRAGLCVLPPVEDGSKRPQDVDHEWNQFKIQRPDPALMKSWYPGRSGLGVISGAVSGDVECLDYDDRETYTALVETARATGLGDLVDRIEAGYCDDTPRGGVRWLWRCHGAPRVSNEKLACRPKRPEEKLHEKDKKKTLIELPDYAIVAPTNGAVHPTGKAYVRRSGDFDNIATITVEERAALLELARSFDQMPARKPFAAPKTRGKQTGSRPGAEYNARTSWGEILEPEGWSHVFTRGEVSYWRRPGKDFGISATTNFGDSDLFYPFSSSTAFEPNQSYSKFAAYTVLHHGGDFAAAARALAERGFGEPASRSHHPGRVSGEDDAGDCPKCGKDSCDETCGVDCDASVPKTDYRFEPAFPPEHFVSRFIAYTERCTDAPLEYAEATALAILANSTAGQRAFFGPYPNGLATNLYMLIVGETTAFRKSTTIRLGRTILDGIDRDSLLPDLASPEGFIEDLARRSGENSLWRVDEFSELMEKLHHAKHMIGLRGILLTVYDGGDYRYRRHSKRKRSGEAIEDIDEITSPHLTVLGATTPVIFEALSARDVMTGLLPRFAIIMPTGKPARREFSETSPGDQDAAEEIASWILQLLARRPGRIRFAPEALRTLDAYAREIEELSSKPETESGKAMLARLPSMAFKVAMLAAAGQKDIPETLSVAEQDALAAVSVLQRWKHDALAFASRVGENTFERTAKRCLRALAQAKDGVLPRRTIARLAHCDKKLLDLIEATLLDRGEISLWTQKNANNVVVNFWRLLK